MELMKRIFLIMVIIGFYQVGFSQSAEYNVARSNCKCSPILFRFLSPENKIVYLQKNKGDLKAGQKLTLSILDKTGSRWSFSHDIQIGSEDFCENLLDSFEVIELADQRYIYFVTDCNNNGAAYSGKLTLHFLFYDLQKDSLFDLVYVKWAGEALGQFSVKNNADINSYKIFEEKANDYITKKYGSQNLNIDDPKNFVQKWQIDNEGIFEEIKANTDNHKSVKIVCPAYDKSFFSRVEIQNYSDTLNTKDYIFSAGFVSPVLIYSKQKEKTSVLWIPQGYPSGANWGRRSFKIEGFKGNMLVVSNEDLKLEIDIVDYTIKAYSK